MSARFIALPALLSLLGVACASPPPTAPAPVDYLLLDGIAIDGDAEGTSLVRARIVDTDDPAVHALLASHTTASEEVLAAVRSSAGTRVVSCPSVLLMPGHEGSVSVGEQVRYAETRVVPGPDGPTYTIEEHEDSPGFAGYELALTPSTPAPDGRIDLAVMFRQSDLDPLRNRPRLIAEVPLRTVTLRPAEISILRVEPRQP